MFGRDLWRAIYDESPILQQFLSEHPDWYTEEVYRILTGKSPTRYARQNSQSRDVWTGR
jgi:hypothetical protein